MLDGMATIDGYVERCRELGMTAMALTDHGNMHGVVEFHDACRKAGIKPILGCEFYSTHERTSEIRRTSIRTSSSLRWMKRDTVSS